MISSKLISSNFLICAVSAILISHRCHRHHHCPFRATNQHLSKLTRENLYHRAHICLSSLLNQTICPDHQHRLHYRSRLMSNMDMRFI
ncbi:hypothetical protein F4804DRAFT_298055 [Jackrogersella minutella]|nr:hypothetical protein F4804DRAFT_298055 [Jackrogersella minutella]